MIYRVVWRVGDGLPWEYCMTRLDRMYTIARTTRRIVTYQSITRLTT